MQWLWTTGKNSRNPKTGPIPTAYPANLDDAWASCDGCPLRGGRRRAPNTRSATKPECYYWYGLPAIGNKNVIKAAEKGADYTLNHALDSKRLTARAVRMSGGGDSSATTPKHYNTMRDSVKALGLAWLDYTHFWHSKGSWLRGKAMASCDRWGDAIDACRAGWRAAIHVPWLHRPKGTAYGYTYTLCPAQRTDLPNKITCNDCRLCDASRQKPDIIVFLNH